MAAGQDSGLRSASPADWKGEGGYSTVRENDGSVLVSWSAGENKDQRAELQVWFDTTSDHRVSSVRVSLPGLTPSGLARFPWARMLGVADSARVLLEPGRGMGSLRFFDYAEQPTRDTAPSRPGRPGHPDSFYQEVANQYMTMRSAGVTNPTAELGKARHVSRSTAAGWVGRARKRGYLPQGRPGRAG